MASSCAQNTRRTLMQSAYGNRIVMLDIDTNGRIEERIPGTGQECWLDRTLLGAMYPTIHVALVSVPTEPLNDVEEATVADRMTAISHDGIVYRMVGASGSAKNGILLLRCPARAPHRQTVPAMAGSCHHLLRNSRVELQGCTRGV